MSCNTLFMGENFHYFIKIILFVGMLLKLSNQLLFLGNCMALMLNFFLESLDSLAVFLDFPKKSMNLFLMAFVVLLQCLSFSFQWPILLTDFCIFLF